MPAHDHAQRRRGRREGRQRGCWVYVTAEELERAGHRDSERPPFYRTWAGPRGRVVIQLYREP